jgi:serine/threonine protein kinase
VKEPEKNKRKWSLVGTGGYRAPERYLQSLEFDETSPLQWKKGDIWSFGALVLKMFLSHYGPGSQRQVAILYLWRYATFPWNLEDKMADKVLQVSLDLFLGSHMFLVQQLKLVLLLFVCAAKADKNGLPKLASSVEVSIGLYEGLTHGATQCC